MLKTVVAILQYVLFENNDYCLDEQRTPNAPFQHHAELPVRWKTHQKMTMKQHKAISVSIDGRWRHLKWYEEIALHTQENLTSLCLESKNNNGLNMSHKKNLDR